MPAAAWVCNRHEFTYASEKSVPKQKILKNIRQRKIPVEKQVHESEVSDENPGPSTSSQRTSHSNLAADAYRTYEDVNATFEVVETG
jgi:hypothetical protein